MDQNIAGREVAGRLTIAFDAQGNAVHTLEGRLLIGPLVAKLEELKLRFTLQMIQAADAEQAKQQAMRPGIILPNGPIPPMQM